MIDEQLEMYPNYPGYKVPGTSKQSAEKVSGRAPVIRMLILGALAEFGPMTADEVAVKLDKSLLSVRPRFSELRKMGKIVDAGIRRENLVSGHNATVWRLAR